jgi:hypothetical protein
MLIIWFMVKTVVYSGPIYNSMQIDSNKILFANVGGGLVAKGGE